MRYRKGGVEGEEGRSNVAIAASIRTSKWLIPCLVTFRVVSALFLSDTYFVPDEYWQSLEVAHKLAFGYGHLTWEWTEGIRGYFHPLLFAALYKLLDAAGLDSTLAISVAPRVLQGLLAAWSDFHMVAMAERYFPPGAAGWTLAVYLSTWTNIYCMCRTLSNSLETVFTVVALRHWHWPWTTRIDIAAVRRGFIYAAIACLVRPTAAMLWLPLSAYLLVSCRTRVWRILLYCVTPVAVLSLITSVLLDSVCYGRLVFVQWSFLQFNFLNDLGAVYGEHPWHWYFTAGVPALLGTWLPVAAIGIHMSDWRHKQLAVVSLVVVLANSFVSHKEFRFLLPLLPPACLYSGYAVHRILSTNQLPKHVVYGALVLAAVPQILASVYLGGVHQSGTTSVMRHLDKHALQLSDSGRLSELKVLFLMPCHSTPLYSHLHRNVSLEFLTCPPLQASETEDEAFFRDPNSWLANRADRGRIPLPSHIVLFDVLQPQIQIWLDEHGYIRNATFFHSHFPDGRVGSSVILYSSRINS